MDFIVPPLVFFSPPIEIRLGCVNKMRRQEKNGDSPSPLSPAAECKAPAVKGSAERGRGVQGEFDKPDRSNPPHPPALSPGHLALSDALSLQAGGGGAIYPVFVFSVYRPKKLKFSAYSAETEFSSSSRARHS